MWPNWKQNKTPSRILACILHLAATSSKSHTIRNCAADFVFHHLDIFRCSGQLFCSLSLYLTLSDVALWLDSGCVILAGIDGKSSLSIKGEHKLLIYGVMEGLALTAWSEGYFWLLGSGITPGFFLEKSLFTTSEEGSILRQSKYPINQIFTMVAIFTSHFIKMWMVWEVEQLVFSWWQVKLKVRICLSRSTPSHQSSVSSRSSEKDSFME